MTAARPRVSGAGAVVVGVKGVFYDERWRSTQQLHVRLDWE